MGYNIYLTIGLDGDKLDSIEVDNKEVEVNEIKVDYPDEIGRALIKLINLTKFKSYYYRMIHFEDELKFVVDYGSHSRFITIECEDKDSWDNYLKYQLRGE